MNSVLILVQSCFQKPFRALLRTQERTWLRLTWPGVSTLFYFAGEHAQRTPERLVVKCPDDYVHLGWALKLALDAVWDDPWTHLFRTNASSYVCQRRLWEFVQGLPLTGCYHGIAGPVSNLPDIQHVGGAGMILSRDVVEILRAKLDPKGTPYVDDGECGVILHRHGIVPQLGERCDTAFEPRPWPDTYHYKVRSANRSDRAGESQTMHELFALKRHLYE